MSRQLLLLLPFLLGMNLLSPAASAARLGASDIDVEILGDRYGYHEQYTVESKHRTYRAYVQANSGEQYSIGVRNRTPYRIGLVIAVDGRNVISGDASQLRSTERMYILGPHEYAVYSGWRTSRDEINRFYFTDEDDSYSAAWGDYSAMGVIAAAAFREVPRNTMHEHTHSDPARKSAQAEKSHSAQPGTGFGEREWSPSREVEFVALDRPFARHFLKYEWRDTLCRRGIIECYDHRTGGQRHNRMWPSRLDDGFAPPPPR